MRVVVVSAAVGPLRAPEATGAVRAGWQETVPRDDVRTHILSDGARGLRDALGASSGTVVVETGDLLDRSDAAFHGGSTDAVARALLDAVDGGARRVVFGMGPSRVHDGGAGLLHVVRERWGDLVTARAALGGVELVVAGADPLPLLGLHGAGALLAPVVGAREAQDREAEVARFAAAVEEELAPLDLVTGRRVRWSGVPYGGLAGGAGFALLALGARAAGGFELTAVETSLEDEVTSADLCVAVLEVLDAVALERSAVSAVAPGALEAAIPVVVISGEDQTSRRHRAALGIAGVHTSELDAASLRDMARRVARTWSHG